MSNSPQEMSPTDWHDINEVPFEELKPESGLYEIDGWEDPTHEVSVLWDGSSQFMLGLTPKKTIPGALKLTPIGVTFEEVQQIRHEQHSYPYIAPKLGHTAAVYALGIPEAA